MVKPVSSRQAPERMDWIGRALPRPDGSGKVSGTAMYPQDLPLPDGCLHAATVRAPLACARIVGIDRGPAEALPGVVRVLTAADVPGTNRFGLLEPDQPVLAEKRIRGTSDVVALVIATTEQAARAGARATVLSLEPEPALFDPEHALDADAVLVHPARGAAGRHANLLAERIVRRGDAECVMREAAVVVEGVYRTGFVEHAFLTPEAGIAIPGDDGRLVLHTATQWPEADLRQAAVALGEPLERLRLIQATIGGAFGGREDISLHILLLLAARATGRPVRMVWDRAESVRGHGKRHPVRIHHRLAADANGRMLAATADVLVDAGCYASTSGRLLDNALAHVFGAYQIDSVAATGRAVFTNNPFTCAFRGFGVNQVTFAMEQQVNRLATALDADPAELRRANFARAPVMLASGCEFTSHGGLRKTLSAAIEAAGRKRLPSAGDNFLYGRGLACAVKNIGFGFGLDDAATAEVSVTESEAVVRIGAADVGQGIETVLTQIAASALGIEPGRVRVEWQDSRRAPEAGSSSASRQTVAAGNAVLGACEVVLRTVARHGGLADCPNGSATARFTWRFPPTATYDTQPARHLAAFGWSTCVADVAVDTGTGEVRVLRVVDAVDAGRVINPALFRGQVEGGVVMGQGYALQERFRLVDGMPASLGLDACAIPTAVDAVPDIETVVIEDPEPVGPFGARGVGEITMIAVVPAITAAIHDACGAWIDELPATPERVRAALRRAVRDGPLSSPTGQPMLPKSASVVAPDD